MSKNLNEFLDVPKIFFCARSCGLWLNSISQRISGDVEQAQTPRSVLIRRGKVMSDIIDASFAGGMDADLAGIVAGMTDTHAHLSTLESRGIDAQACLRGLFGAGFNAVLDVGTNAADLAGRLARFGGWERVFFSAGIWPSAQAAADRINLMAVLEAQIAGAVKGRKEVVGGVPPKRNSGQWAVSSERSSAMRNSGQWAVDREEDEEEREQGKMAGSRLVAIGEFGLDYHENDYGAAGLTAAYGASPNVVASTTGSTASGAACAAGELMEMQLVLARRLGLPVIIHSRDAANETAEVLARVPGVNGVIHCFSYGPEEARRFLDMGFYISFAGNLTYKKSNALREAMRLVPADRLLFETDAPYLAPEGYRGQPAHPGMSAVTCRLAAQLRGVDFDALKAVNAANAERLFFNAGR
jgi:TatD DNase family protein